MGDVHRPLKAHHVIVNMSCPPHEAAGVDGRNMQRAARRRGPTRETTLLRGK
jgi:hypothetical protein